MQTVSEKTVREIAIENPASTRVFEALGIDYCCGGRRTLTDACASAGVDLNRLLGLLDEASRHNDETSANGWETKPLRELVGHIVGRHHAFMRAETPRLQGLLAKVVSKHGPDHPEVVEIEKLFVAISQELATHLFKEEQVLFPYIQKMEQAVSEGAKPEAAFFGTVQRPISNMIADHDDAGALLARMRGLSNGYEAPPEACPTFVAAYRGLDEFERDLHQHVHLENNILFPRAIAMEQAA